MGIINFKEITLQELKRLQETINTEIIEREAIHRNELWKEVLQAMEKFTKETGKHIHIEDEEGEYKYWCNDYVLEPGELFFK